MKAFVEECRHEWKRLGVPGLLADEMAAELEADLTEAEAEGISAADLLGESDPHRFAATWATERGIVPESPPWHRKRLWIGLAACLLFACVALGSIALVRIGSGKAANPVKVPELIGVKACDAVRMGQLAGLAMRHTQYRGRRCDALVVSQKPAAGKYVPLHTPTTIRLTLVRIPRLVGLRVCKAKLVAARAGIFVRKRSPGDPTPRALPQSSRCTNVVITQTPAADRIVRGPAVFVTVTVSQTRS
jgi:beta-lactam-binding protein with PASTA domain